MIISGHQRSSVLISAHQCSSVLLSSNQCSSVLIDLELLDAVRVPQTKLELDWRRGHTRWERSHLMRGAITRKISMRP